MTNPAESITLGKIAIQWPETEIGIANLNCYVPTVISLASQQLKIVKKSVT